MHDLVKLNVLYNWGLAKTPLPVNSPDHMPKLAKQHSMRDRYT